MAAGHLEAARIYRRHAELNAASSNTTWRQRRAYRCEAEDWAEREAKASARFERLGGPERDRLAAEIDRLEERREELSAAKVEREDWLGAHPRPPGGWTASTPRPPWTRSFRIRASISPTVSTCAPSISAFALSPGPIAVPTSAWISASISDRAGSPCIAGLNAPE